MVRRILKRVAALLIALVLCAAGTELFVRVADPYGASHLMAQLRYRTELLQFRLKTDRLFVHRPDQRLELFGWEVRTDSRGLRGPERAVPKPEGTRRLLFLGDSVTFGWGVDLEDTFVAMVEEDLNARGGPPVEAVNAGHLFHDTTQERAVLEDVGLAYEPDVVFLVFVGNDVAPTKEVRKSAEKAAELGLDPAVEAELAYRKSVLDKLALLEPVLPHTHNLARFAFNRYRATHFENPLVTRAETPEDEVATTTYLDKFHVDYEAGWELCKQAIARMQALAGEHGYRFHVLDTTRQPFVEELCGEAGIGYSRIAFSEEERHQPIRNSVADPHANRLGHRFYADKILRVIDEHGLLP